MPHSHFRLRAGQIRPIAVGYGACYATNEITREGKSVGYCYREEPDNELDSGWRFFSGNEPQEYVDDPNNLALYDVNTIANYDPGITAVLESPYGSAFERDASGKLVKIQDEA